MADNTVLDSGSGGDTIATDDIAGVKFPRSKIVIGADGTNDGDVSSANPLPVTGTVDLGATDNAVLDSIVTNTTGLAGCVGGSELQVDVVSSALPSGASTAANQSTANGSLADIETNTDFGAVTGGGVEASALRVTIASDSTGLVSVDDNGGSLTVDGTVTANLSATDNAVLDAINSNTTGLAGCVSGSEMQVDVVSSALPTGAATAANQATANSALSNIETAVQLIDNAISGSEMQVDVVAALPAGTNLIGQTTPAANASATGTSTFYDPDLDETKIEVTDNPNVRIYSITAFNTTAAPLYLQLFDADADNVTVGTTAPTNQYIIPGNANSDGAGFTLNFAVPKSYSTGFTVACTTDSEGSSAPGAGACQVNIEYISAA